MDLEEFSKAYQDAFDKHREENPDIHAVAILHEVIGKMIDSYLAPSQRTVPQLPPPAEAKR